MTYKEAQLGIGVNDECWIMKPLILTDLVPESYAWVLPAQMLFCLHVLEWNAVWKEDTDKGSVSRAVSVKGRQK